MTRWHYIIAAIVLLSFIRAGWSVWEYSKGVM
jgi:hypothetical protein